MASGEKPDSELQNLFAIIASLIAPLIQMTILYEEKMAAVANPFEPLVERIVRYAPECLDRELKARTGLALHARKRLFCYSEIRYSAAITQRKIIPTLKQASGSSWP